MQTRTTKEPETVKRWEYRGFFITESFDSKAGTGRTCNTRQAFITTLPGFPRYKEWNSTLRRAKLDVDGQWSNYVNGFYSPQAQGRYDFMDTLATSEQKRMRQDAVAARKEADRARAEKAAREEAERDRADRVEFLKTVPEAELWAELERREATK